MWERLAVLLFSATLIVGPIGFSAWLIVKGLAVGVEALFLALACLVCVGVGMLSVRFLLCPPAK